MAGFKYFTVAGMVLSFLISCGPAFKYPIANSNEFVDLDVLEGGWISDPLFDNINKVEYDLDLVDNGFIVTSKGENKQRFFVFIFKINDKYYMEIPNYKLTMAPFENERCTVLKKVEFSKNNSYIQLFDINIDVLKRQGIQYSPGKKHLVLIRDPESRGKIRSLIESEEIDIFNKRSNERYEKKMNSEEKQKQEETQITE